jgi:ATP-dependent RNA helicase UAP56/SUB2
MEDDPKPCSALILCNVRELAYQIKKEVIRFTKHMPHIRSHVFFGGVPIKEDIAVLEGKEAPHIVIGTPGRVLALVNQGQMKLNDLRFFILDECDKMLVESDMRAQVQKIFMKGNSNNRQVMMFSATLS